MATVCRSELSHPFSLMQAGVNLATETALAQIMLPSGTPARGSERDRSLHQAAEQLAEASAALMVSRGENLHQGPDHEFAAGAEQQWLSSACAPGRRVQCFSRSCAGWQARRALEVSILPAR